MRILHLCLSCFYIDGYSYQENLLPRFNKLDGNEVLIIASTETYLDQKTLGYVSPKSYMNEDGIPVIRVGYRKFLPHSIMKKLRMYEGVFRLMEDFNPDVVLFHGLCAWELTTVAKYKKKYPTVRIYADSHEDFNNSARGFVSRVFLHGMFYRTILRYSMQCLEKILYISLETRGFVKEIYGISEQRMEFFPLGGEVYPDQLYGKQRNSVRKLMKFDENNIVIVQSGKMNKEKKILESIETFMANEDDSFRLLLIGSIDDSIQEKFNEYINRDNRIIYVGWKESLELMDFLCAADVYLQPGTQSVTMQNAICLRCPVILDDVVSHKPYVSGNGWLLNEKKALQTVLDEISRNPKQLSNMSEQSLTIAKDMLDYRKLAKRLYS